MKFRTLVAVAMALCAMSSIAFAEEEGKVAHALFTGMYSKLDDFEEKKVCSKGKPCGNTCINVNYTCHIDQPAPFVPAVPPAPPVGKPSLPDVALKPSSQNCSPVAVAAVVDGDTLVVDSSSGRVRVRISQVDAPESSQAFGREAKACLASLVANQPVRMCSDGSDRYGRTLANVYAGSSNVGQELVRRGCAWAYSKYLEAGSSLPWIQSQAQSQNAGLWAQPAIAPWDYRGGSAPVPKFATGETPVTVTTSTMATPVNRILDWAESVFPSIFQNGGENIVVDDGSYRCYDNQICAGSLNERVMVYNSGVLSPVSGENELLPAVAQDGF